MVKFSGKRPNCLFEVYTQFRKFVQDANVAKKRDGTCLSHYNEFVRDHKLPTNSEKFDVGYKNYSSQVVRESIKCSQMTPIVVPSKVGYALVYPNSNLSFYKTKRALQSSNVLNENKKNEYCAVLDRVKM